MFKESLTKEELDLGYKYGYQVVLEHKQAWGNHNVVALNIHHR